MLPFLVTTETLFSYIIPLLSSKNITVQSVPHLQRRLPNNRIIKCKRFFFLPLKTLLRLKVFFFNSSVISILNDFCLHVCPPTNFKVAQPQIWRFPSTSPSLNHSQMTQNCSRSEIFKFNVLFSENKFDYFMPFHKFSDLNTFFLMKYKFPFSIFSCVSSLSLFPFCPTQLWLTVISFPMHPCHSVITVQPDHNQP